MPAGARPFLACCLVFLVIGCSTPEQRLQAETRALRSWIATLRLTSEGMADGTIPRGYAKQVLEAAHQHERSLRAGPEWQVVPNGLKREFSIAAARLAAGLDEPPLRPAS